MPIIKYIYFAGENDSQKPNLCQHCCWLTYYIGTTLELSACPGPDAFLLCVAWLNSHIFNFYDVNFYLNSTIATLGYYWAVISGIVVMQSLNSLLEQHSTN